MAEDQQLTIRRVRLTREGLRRLEAELAELEDHELPALAAQMREIKATSADLAESGEYAAVLEDLDQLQARAAMLRAMIGSGEVVARPSAAAGRVHLGSRITLALDDEQATFQIVGAAEADALEGRVSDESPLGRAVLGHRVDDVVEWQAPAGVQRARVTRVA